MITTQLNALLQLQTLDLTLLQLKKEAGSIPARKDQYTLRTEKALAALEQAKTALRDREKAIKALEGDVGEVRERINRYRRQQMEVKTNESYKALEHEIAGCETEISALEDRELELMEGVEPLSREVREAGERLAIAEKAIQEDCVLLDQRLETIRAQFEELKAQRDQHLPGIDEEILRKYLGHLSAKQDAFLVPVHQQTCGGCHMKLTLQVQHDLHAAAKWTSCGYCGRMLYDPDVV